MGFKDKMLAMKDKSAELLMEVAGAAKDSANTIKFTDVQGTFDGESASILLGADAMVLTLGENGFYTLPDDLTNIEFEYFEEEGRSMGGTLKKGALGLASFSLAMSASKSMDEGRSGSGLGAGIMAVAVGSKAKNTESMEMKGYVAMFMEFTDLSMFSARLHIKYWARFKFEYDAFDFQNYKVEAEGEIQEICDDVVQLQNTMKELGAKEKMDMLKVIKERNFEVEEIQQRWDEVKFYAEQRGVSTT
jgi:hypothetical protein